MNKRPVMREAPVINASDVRKSLLSIPRIITLAVKSIEAINDARNQGLLYLGDY